MHCAGLAIYDQEDDAVRWIAVRHAPDHIHLVAMLARQDRTRPQTWNDYSALAKRAGRRSSGSGCAGPLRETGPRPADRPGPSQRKRAAVDCPRHPGSRSGAPSAPPPPGRPASRSSSPGWTGLASWSVSGSAHATPAR
jgi:hypothetical protein